MNQKELVDHNIELTQLLEKGQQERAKLRLVPKLPEQGTTPPEESVKIELQEEPLLSKKAKVVISLGICGFAYFAAAMVPTTNGLHVFLIPMQVGSAYYLGWLASKS